MKVCVAYEIKNGPWGGGNQFLKALCLELLSHELLTSRPEEADVILFNSHQHAKELVHLKNQFPDKTFIHRVDGPMRRYNSTDDQRDDIVKRLNENIADGTIFQSSWSLRKNSELGFTPKNPLAVIKNAPGSMFFKTRSSEHAKKNKILIASFSSNPKKGYETYQYLDETLDFADLEIVFAGRSPVEFRNIKNAGCLTSTQLCDLMESCSIFLTASECDPCSNSLLEALAAGLPAVALNDGGHPEIIGHGGILYSDKSEIQEKISELFRNLSAYRNNIKISSIEEITHDYVTFFKRVKDERNTIR